VLQAEACNTDTTQTHPHQISNTQRTENKMVCMEYQTVKVNIIVGVLILVKVSDAFPLMFIEPCIIVMVEE